MWLLEPPPAIGLGCVKSITRSRKAQSLAAALTRFCGSGSMPPSGSSGVQFSKVMVSAWTHTFLRFGAMAQVEVWTSLCVAWFTCFLTWVRNLLIHRIKWILPGWLKKWACSLCLSNKPFMRTFQMPVPRSSLGKRAWWEWRIRKHAHLRSPGMVEKPLLVLSDLQIGEKKVTLNHLAVFVLCIKHKSCRMDSVAYVWDRYYTYPISLLCESNLFVDGFSLCCTTTPKITYCHLRYAIKEIVITIDPVHWHTGPGQGNKIDGKSVVGRWWTVTLT